MTTPGLREQQQDSGNYKAPLLAYLMFREMPLS